MAYKLRTQEGVTAATVPTLEIAKRLAEPYAVTLKTQIEIYQVECVWTTQTLNEALAQDGTKTRRKWRMPNYPLSMKIDKLPAAES